VCVYLTLSTYINLLHLQYIYTHTHTRARAHTHTHTHVASAAPQNGSTHVSEQRSNGKKP